MHLLDRLVEIQVLVIPLRKVSSTRHIMLILRHIQCIVFSMMRRTRQYTMSYLGLYSRTMDQRRLPSRQTLSQSTNYKSFSAPNDTMSILNFVSLLRVFPFSVYTRMRKRSVDVTAGSNVENSRLDLGRSSKHCFHVGWTAVVVSFALLLFASKCQRSGVLGARRRC
jgi:hypothetical protein